MIHRRKLFKLIYQALGAIGAILIMGSAIVSAINAFPSDALRSMRGGTGLLAVQSWVGENKWFIPVVFAILALIRWIRYFVGPPWIWFHIQYVLDELQTEAFADRTEDEPYHHRVTLFRHVRWYWRHPLTQGWLLPRARSGVITQKTKAAFRAPYEADKQEGVAGKTWAMWKSVSVSNMPDMSTSASEEDIATFAKMGFVTSQWVRDNKPACRSLLGIPVEVNGEHWGVVVFDSRDSREIGAEGAYAVFKLTGKYLGKLLERKST